mmetsp:Transcript_29688/g.82953  ORF Transcript_29688/g.82953 Transcript_29688/m.82953 type:complete len:89 (+) Transcript_29688:30-296(+)
MNSYAYSNLHHSDILAHPKLQKFGKSEAKKNYRKAIIGDADPMDPRVKSFPGDGRLSEWEEHEGYYRVRYDEGPNDKGWRQKHQSKTA